MKYIVFYLSLVVIICSCSSEADFFAGIELPQSVELGLSEVYINGELEPYTPEFLKIRLITN